MPKSKRAKLISLTQTKKRSTRERKEELINKIRDAVNEYENLFVFDISNMRTKYLTEFRKKVRDDGRVFMTKNKVMITALGKGKEDEHEKNLHEVSAYLTGIRGLLFTNQTLEQIEGICKQIKISDFAKAGFVATRDFILEEGVVEWMPHSLEERLVRLGLPIEVKNGKISIKYKTQVCKEGDALTPEQAKILKHFGIQMSEFSIGLCCWWNKKTNKVVKLREGDLIISKTLKNNDKKKNIKKEEENDSEGDNDDDDEDDENMDE